MIRSGSRLLVALAVLSVTTFGAAPASAQEAAPGVLTLAVEPPLTPDLPPRVAATLTDADGNAVNGVSIHFSIGVDIGGERFAAIGRSSTDAAGVARVNLAPRHDRILVKARFSGDERAGPVEVAEELEFPADTIVSALPTHSRHSLLEPLQESMPGVISGLVAALWIVLVALALQTRRATRRAAADAGVTSAPEAGGDGSTDPILEQEARNQTNGGTS